MFPFQRPKILFGALFGALGLVAAVSPAHAQDRCEGTLCDLYYEHVGQPPQQPATAPIPPSAKPIIAPSGGLLSTLFSGGQQSQPPGQPGATAATGGKRPLVAVQGGGLVGMMQGSAPQRCTGTLCDLYYGGPPPEQPAAPVQERAATGAEGTVAADETPEAREPARVVEEPVERHCADTRDPWSCYRR